VVQAQLEKEAREEMNAIEKVCNDLGLEIYEVCTPMMFIPDQAF